MQGGTDIHDSDFRQVPGNDMPINADRLESYWQYAYQPRIGNVGAWQIGMRAKVGAVAGWAVAAADDLPYTGTLPASQTTSTLILPIDGLRVGDTITGFKVNAQVESAGGAVTLDAELRATTNVAADPTDALVGTAMTQVSVTTDTAVAQEKTGLAEVVASGKSYYLKVIGTTAAATDIILQHCEIMTKPGTAEIVAETIDIHIARAAGKVVSIEATITGAIATDASRTVTIDLQRSTAEAAFASILSGGGIVFNNTSVLRRTVAGTLTANPTALVDNDIVRLVITPAGTGGIQAQGLAVCVRFKEGK